LVEGGLGEEDSGSARRLDFYGPHGVSKRYPPPGAAFLEQAIDVNPGPRGRGESNGPRVRSLRVDFERRTGNFTSEDPWFEARSGAFWDDALTTHAFGREVAGLLPDGARFWVEPLARAHRGLFQAKRDKDGEQGFHLVDAWSGAEFRVEAGRALRDALDQAGG